MHASTGMNDREFRFVVGLAPGKLAARSYHLPPLTRLNAGRKLPGKGGLSPRTAKSRRAIRRKLLMMSRRVRRGPRVGSGPAWINRISLAIHRQ